jgi:hypothetical protein
MIDQQIEIPAEDGNGATFINCLNAAEHIFRSIAAASGRKTK